MNRILHQLNDKTKSDQRNKNIRLRLNNKNLQSKIEKHDTIIEECNVIVEKLKRINSFSSEECDILDQKNIELMNKEKETLKIDEEHQAKIDNLKHKRHDIQIKFDDEIKKINAPLDKKEFKEARKSVAQAVVVPKIKLEKKPSRTAQFKGPPKIILKLK